MVGAGVGIIKFIKTRKKGWIVSISFIISFLGAWMGSMRSMRGCVNYRYICLLDLERERGCIEITGDLFMSVYVISCEYKSACSVYLAGGVILWMACDGTRLDAYAHIV